MAAFKTWIAAAMKYLFIAAIVFGLGVYAGYTYFVPELKRQLAECQTEVAIYKGQLKSVQQALTDEKAKPAKIETVTKTKTEIAYVPKETVIYKDAVTGETVTGKEGIDADITTYPPRIGVRYNGKVFDLAGISGESAKFKDGKLVGESWTTATLDVTKLVDHEVAYRLADQEKDISLGGYLTNKGFVGSIGVVRGNREYKIIGKVPKIKEFYGAGVEFKF